MDRITRRHCLLAAGSAAFPALAKAEASALQKLLDARLQDDGVALAAGRLSGGKTEFAGASKTGPRPGADSVFEIGSITKTFTALLLADAVVRGELKLDDAVEAALPEGLRLRDSQGQPLRWVDLATHRSGLPRLASNKDCGQGYYFDDPDNPAWATLCKDTCSAVKAMNRSVVWIAECDVQ